jgi:hypothetical protein
MINKLFENEYAAFIVVATAITILILFSKLRFKRLVLLWKSILITYLVFLVFATLMAIGDEKLTDRIHFMVYPLMIFMFILLTPGMLIQALIFGGGPCLSGNHTLFNIVTIAFLFYAIVIWGIMKLISKSKEPNVAENKQDNEVEKQTPTETDA